MNHTTKHLSASGARQPAAMAGHIAIELNRYDAHLRDVRGLAAGTRKHCISIVGRLLHRKFAKRPIEIAKLRPDDIRAFLASQLDACQTPSQASKLASALRSYLRYRTTCGDQAGALLAVIQNPVHWSLANRHISPHVIRHTTAMHLLQSGVDISVIALWLGHESPLTTHQYVEADLAMKERALARLHEPAAKIQRYMASDSLLAFLRRL